MYDEILVPFGLESSADAFASSSYSDVLNLSKYKKAKFIVYVGNTSTGSVALNIQSCQDTTPTVTGNVPFRYRLLSSATNVYGEWTAADSAYTTVTTTSKFIVEMEVNSDGLLGTDKYCRVRGREVVNDPMDGCIVPILMNPRYGEAVMDSATI